MHGVVERHPVSHHSARGGYVYVDLFLRIVVLEKDQLRDHYLGHHVLDRTGDEHDAFLEQSRIDVVGALAAIGLFDHHRDEIVHVGIDGISHLRSSAANAGESSGWGKWAFYPPMTRPAV